MNGGVISMMNFTNDSYQYGEFLNGDYKLGYPMNVNLMWDMLPIARRTPTSEGYRKNELGSVINDYSGWENKSAAYAHGRVGFRPDPLIHSRLSLSKSRDQVHCHARHARARR